MMLAEAAWQITRALNALSRPPSQISPSALLAYLRKDFLGVERIGMEIRRRVEERGRDDREARRQIRQPTAMN